jgi:hypothetical protein
VYSFSDLFFERHDFNRVVERLLQPVLSSRRLDADGHGVWWFAGVSIHIVVHDDIAPGSTSSQVLRLHQEPTCSINRPRGHIPFVQGNSAAAWLQPAMGKNRFVEPSASL